MTEYFIDLSEFIRKPYASGIQRTCGELCKNWSSEVRLRPIMLNSHGQWATLPPGFLKKISQFIAGTQKKREKIRRWLQKIYLLAEQGKGAIILDEKSTIIIAEVFFDLPRIQWYRKHLATHQNLFFLIYDIFPLLYPNYILCDFNYNLYAYFKLIAEAKHVAFISTRTRQEYWQRLRRRPGGGGPVLRCGSNSIKFSKKPARADLNNMTFLVVGTVSPKKKHAQILAAFAELWKNNINVKLIFAGEYADSKPMALHMAQLLQDNPLFQYFQTIDDDTLKKLYQGSRASICIGLEGYGLPAVESLFFNRPVIIADTVPSVEQFTQGTVRVDTTSVTDIKNAVLLLLNNHFYEKKVAEIQTLELPTWELFTQQFAEWINATLHEAPCSSSINSEGVNENRIY